MYLEFTSTPKTSSCSHWKCPKCKTIYDDQSDTVYINERRHDETLNEVECGRCGESMEWHPFEWNFHHKKQYPISFDYTFQVYRMDSNGEVYPREEKFDFACIKCGGPAHNHRNSVRFEYYSCLNCKHQFAVN